MDNKLINRYFVYIVQCKHGTFYTGYTNNLEKRIGLHDQGKGAKYLRGKGPVRLVYAKKFKFCIDAQKEERRIKKLSRKQKEQLISTQKIK